ncbi:MAG: hypothetical protein EPO01_21950 [Aquabacterium sp.]|jgi:hypothetical protein|nr:MAG: hypothetical protein EPO12_09670 [Aquabacterium sp.]TAL13117.1 MAG: hypothetical protein EPO01_21950 [Aquabacterium sp.]
MRVRGWLLIVIFSTIGIGLMLWRHQASLRPAEALSQGLRKVSEAVAPSATTLPPPAAGKLQKCVSPGRALYTDGPCPAGTRPAEVRGGSVTVVAPVPATTVAASASAAKGAASGGLPTVRDVLLGSEAEMQALREKRESAIVDR